MSTVSMEEANFVPRRVNSRYTVMMPSFIAEHGIWDNWEPERFRSMEENLKKGDILFDVGAETGSISAIYAQFVGGDNMCMFEGNPDNWQNIKATWDIEKLPAPKATFCGLVSNRNTQDADFDREQRDGWPIVALTGRIWRPRSYRYVHEHAAITPQISIDNFVVTREIEPEAITIDTEGAELLVLKGARNTLEVLRPLVWASLHDKSVAPDMVHGTAEETHDFMKSCGYIGEHLADDHESHWLYRPV